MDIFKFYPVFDDITLYNGIMVQGIKSAMWIERYRDAGEFTITADISSGIKDVLSIGSLISHVNTLEVMIVENHEVSDAQGDDLEITITGRSLETILEQRVVGAFRPFPGGPPSTVIIPADFTWRQAVELINLHINPTRVSDPGDGIAGFKIFDYVWNTTGVSVAREIPMKDVYSALLELLAEDDLGIAIERPFEMGVNTTNLVVHDGVDVSDSVVFSFDSGDIVNADYLWSNKTDKNSVLVTSKWTQVMIRNYSGYERRVFMVDGSDIDSDYSDQPDPATLVTIQNALTVLGNSVLKSSKQIALSKAQAGKDSKRYEYRRHFKVGDIVMIDGMFNESSKMRVVEYVQIYDKDGSSGYPTLTTWPGAS